MLLIFLSVPCIWWASLLLLSRFSFVFWRFDFNISVWVTLSSSSLEITELLGCYKYVFGQIWEAFRTYFFNYSLSPFPSSPRTPIRHMLIGLMIYTGPLGCHFSCFFLSVPQTGKSPWSYFEFSDSYFCLLLIPFISSSAFLISIIVLFIFRITF